MIKKCRHVSRPSDSATLILNGMTTQEFDVLIIGAGLSGIGTACHLTIRHPGRSIAILERRERIGGTWDLFRYPGIRSDADMLTMAYEFRPWRNPQVLASGEAIRQYIAETAAEYGVDEKIHYGLRIVGADWSSADGRWTLTVQRETTGEACRYSCRYLIACTGYYDHDTAYLPALPGLSRFSGRIVHPQHWPEDLDCAGKKIVVIGSGATAVTLVPALTGVAEHVTMLQRSPSYVLSLPSVDKLSDSLTRFFSAERVYALARTRNIVLVRRVYRACRRWPQLTRRLLLWLVQRQLGPGFDMRHFRPRYLPWDERMCMASDGDLFNALASGSASIVTDEIESITDTGILTKSGREIQAEIIVTATGLNLQMLGGMRLSVDQAPISLSDRMFYKAVLVQDVPNFACVLGYTNAPWTLKSDIAGTYLARLLQHMDLNGYAIATPRDLDGCKTDIGVMGSLKSGYVARAKNILPRQGSKLPWQTLNHYEKDCQILLQDPIEDGVLDFSTVPAEAVA